MFYEQVLACLLVARLDCEFLGLHMFTFGENVSLRFAEGTRQSTILLEASTTSVAESTARFQDQTRQILLGGPTRERAYWLNYEHRLLRIFEYNLEWAHRHRKAVEIEWWRGESQWRLLVYYGVYQ